jgi:hypothetical protein
MVAGPEEQLRKLKAKYPGLYDGKILANPDGSKTLQAKRQDEAGKVITYFYATSPSLCNSYQKNRLDAQHPAETPTSPGTAQAPGNAGDDGKSSSDRSDQSDIAPGKITLAQAKTELESLTYRGVEFFQGNNIHLIKGQYKEGRAYAVLTDFVEIGQINGKAVAAAILLESGGGSGEVRVLSVLSRQDGHWTGIASTDLGDRVVIKSLQIKKDLVIVTMIAKRPNDAGCCPTLPVTDAFSLKGNKLIRVSRK